jgi:ATP-dependent HslUV protease ATP-binding subunit HslU
MPIALPESFTKIKVLGIHVELTPREIVAELDKYIIGQKAAKKAVAIALRNRYRRQKLPAEMADEIAPKNILMIGPTGVGKTEISRRLARLTSSPFLKIEASKFTEVGYVGRDVESMIRDLVQMAVGLIKSEKTAEVLPKAEINVEEKLLDLLLPPPPRKPGIPDEDSESKFKATREKLRLQLHAGMLEERTVEIDVRERFSSPFEIFSNQGVEEIGIQIQEFFPGLGGRTKRRKTKLKEARKYLIEDEQQRLIDMDQINRLAVERVEHSGIIFLDEIDKISGREAGHGPEVSREGVQRDLLPIIEGTTVNTRSGLVKTDHILFIGAGAFHVAKPADMIPELQGRFPIRVELDSLDKGDFIRILTEPETALLKQYQALMATEGVKIQFTDDAVEEIAEIAEKVNEINENIGARRLYTVMEKVMEEISFSAPNVRKKNLTIDRTYVKKQLKDIVEDEDLRRFIL